MEQALVNLVDQRTSIKMPASPATPPSDRPFLTAPTPTPLLRRSALHPPPPSVPSPVTPFALPISDEPNTGATLHQLVASTTPSFTESCLASISGAASPVHTNATGPDDAANAAEAGSDWHLSSHGVAARVPLSRRARIAGYRVLFSLCNEGFQARPG